MEAPQKFAGRMTLGWGDSLDTDFYIGEGLRNEPRLHGLIDGHLFKSFNLERVIKVISKCLNDKKNQAA